jgi:hypothetical protein
MSRLKSNRLFRCRQRRLPVAVLGLKEAFLATCEPGVLIRTWTISAFDRHRGSGCPLTPATPPCVRVRTRRFEKLRRYSSTSEGRPNDLK